MRIRQSLAAPKSGPKSRVVCFYLSLSWILLWTLSTAHAGVPLITNDVGTPGDQHWKLDLAGSLVKSADIGTSTEPLAEISYGWGEDVQLTIAGNTPSRTAGFTFKEPGVAPLLIGIKARFYEDERAGFAISSFPQIELPTLLPIHKQATVDSGTLYVLPIECTQVRGNWAFSTEFGGAHSTANVEQIFYGVAVDYRLGDFRELLFELSSRREIYPRTEKTLLFNMDSRWLLAEGFSFLGSIGHTLQTFPGESPQLLAYFGVEIRH